MDNHNTKPFHMSRMGIGFLLLCLIIFVAYMQQSHAPEPGFQSFSNEEELLAFVGHPVLFPEIENDEISAFHASVDYYDYKDTGEREKAERLGANWDLINGATLFMDVSLRDTEEKQLIPNYFEIKEIGGNKIYVVTSEKINDVGAIENSSCRLYMTWDKRLYYFQASSYIQPVAPDGISAEALFEDLVARLPLREEK